LLLSEVELNEKANNSHVVEWKTKQKSAYNTILTGLKIANRLNKRVRFLTLTTSDLQHESEGYHDKKLNESFRKLKQRVRRVTPLILIRMGYIKVSELRRLYPNKPLNEAIDFEYFKVITNEGNGVIHCLYKGEYLPYNYLVDNWMDIHNSWDLNIKLIRNKKTNFKGSACYVVSQYLGSQESSFQRSSQSWEWLFRGYRKAWLEFKKYCHSKYFYNGVQRRFYRAKKEVNIFKIWEDLVFKKIKPPPYQTKLVVANL
jgi:hypothetical protein